MTFAMVADDANWLYDCVQPNVPAAKPLNLALELKKWCN